MNGSTVHLPQDFRGIATGFDFFRLGDLHISCGLSDIWTPCLSGVCYNDLSKFGLSCLWARKKLRKQTLASIQLTMFWFRHEFIQPPWRATLLWFMELYAIVAARIKSVRAVEDGRNSTSKNHSFPHPFAHFAHSSLGFSEVQRIHRSMDSVCPATEPWWDTARSTSFH